MIEIVGVRFGEAMLSMKPRIAIVFARLLAMVEDDGKARPTHFSTLAANLAPANADFVVV